MKRKIKPGTCCVVDCIHDNTIQSQVVECHDELEMLANEQEVKLFYAFTRCPVVAKRWYNSSNKACELADILKPIVPEVGTFWKGQVNNLILKIILDRRLECPEYNGVSNERFKATDHKGMLWSFSKIKDKAIQVVNWDGEEID